MNILSSLFDELMAIAYLQNYQFKPKYDIYGNLANFELEPDKKTLRKTDNILRLIPDTLAGKKILDIGCNKGFFCFESLRRGAELVVGIDTIPSVIDILNQITAHNQLLAKAKFINKPFDHNIPQIGKFDLIVFLSAYHYVYANLKSHNQIFNLLAQSCKGSVILELPLELDDNFAKKALMKELSGEKLFSYNCHTILHAASCHFESVRYMGNSGFLCTRDIFLLEGPNKGNPSIPEWESKKEPWSYINSLRG